VSAAAWQAHVNALYRARKLTEAAAAAEQGLAQYPDDPTLLALLGVSRMGALQYEPAATALERAIQANPRDPLLRFSLGRCYEELGDGARARAAYDAGLALDAAGDGKAYEDDARYHMLLAHAAGSSTQRARRAYTRALQLDPRNEEARAGLAYSFNASQQQVRDTERASATVEQSEKRSRPAQGPRGAVIVNPLSIMIGAMTKIYTGGAELLIGGRKVAFSAYPQIGVLGDNNSFDLPDGGLGLGLLLGARGNLGDYLSGGYIQPRFGPVHWGGGGWELWAMVGELEAGYLFSLASEGASSGLVLQLGAGVRAVIPSSDTLRVPADMGDGAWGTPQREAQLKTVIAPLLNLSLGYGWR
jgi:tetratricopeptide (TPR) repeat protein